MVDMDWFKICILLASVAISVILFVVLLRYVVVPYIVLRLKCAESRKHAPQPDELWYQDGGLLYIINTDAQGVEIMHATPNDKGGTDTGTWKDTWEEWNKRLRVRTVFYTGERRPLIQR
jgi:hypothetical protein